jgi:hypothetical protein
MSPYDLLLFSQIKNTLEGKRFEDVETIKHEAATFRDPENRVWEVLY